MLYREVNKQSSKFQAGLLLKLTALEIQASKWIKGSANFWEKEKVL